MKTFTVELWACQEVGETKLVTIPWTEDLSIDPDNKNTICVLARHLMKFTNGSRSNDSTYRDRPLSDGDVIRVGKRRFCILPERFPRKQTIIEYCALELGSRL